MSTQTAIHQQAPQASASPQTSRGYGIYAVSLLTLAFTFSYADRHLLSLLVNPVQTSLGLSDTRMGLIQGAAFSIFYVLAALPLARLSDHFNRPTILGACVGIWSGMTMLCGLTSSFWQLMMARIGVAIGEAGLPPGALTLMADTFERRRLPRATSVFMLAPFLGGGLALIGGGALYQMMASWQMPVVPGVGLLERWQLVFLIAGAPGFIIAALVWLTLREPRQVASGHVAPKASTQQLKNFLLGNWRFSILYMVAIAMVVMLFNAHIAWMPAAIVRVHGVDEGFMGMVFGPTYMFAGAFGSLGAGWYLSRGDASTVLERTLLLMRFSVVALLVPAVLAPVVPSLAGGLVLISVAILFSSGINGMSTLVLQYSAPLRMRAQSLAALSLVGALLGTGMGPLVVGMLSDWLDGRVEHSLATALSLLALVVGPICFVLLQVVLREHRRIRLDLRQAETA